MIFCSRSAWQCQVLCHKRMCTYLEWHWHDNVRYSAIKGCVYLERHWQDITVWSAALFPVRFVSHAVLLLVMRFSWRQNHSRSSDIQGVELVRTVCSQLSSVCGYRCHLTLNCSSALHLELSVSFLFELRLATLKIWFRTILVEFFGPCKNRRTAPFCLVPGLSWMMMKEVYVCCLLGFEPCTCYFPNLFLGSEWRYLPTLRTPWSCNTGFYIMS